MATPEGYDKKNVDNLALSTDEVLALPWKIDKQVAHAAYSVDINFATNLPLI